MIDFYKLLGINRNSTKEEIKSSYKNMVKKYHPDINKDDNADKIIRSLNEAKEILLDDLKRKEYDLALEDIDNSKQVSKNKSETYESKTNEYKEAYSDVYVTRWELFVHYIKNGTDNFIIKIFKSFLIIFNYLFFSFAKFVTYVFVYILFLLQELIDFISGILALLGVASLFLLIGSSKSSYISFIPINIERASIYLFFAVLIQFIKFFVLRGSLNLYGLLQKIHDKIFVFILMK